MFDCFFYIMPQLQCADDSYCSWFLALGGIYLLLSIPSVNLLAHSLHFTLANSVTFQRVPCSNLSPHVVQSYLSSRLKALNISQIPCSITCSKLFNDSLLHLEWNPSSLSWLCQLWPLPRQGLGSLMAGFCSCAACAQHLGWYPGAGLHLMLLSVVTGSCKAGPVEAWVPGAQESCIQLLGEPAAQFWLHLESLWGAKVMHWPPTGRNRGIGPV